MDSLTLTVVSSIPVGLWTITSLEEIRAAEVGLTVEVGGDIWSWTSSFDRREEHYW